MLPGGATQRRREGQHPLLPQGGDVYHPDLIGASDAVLGKARYSTVAETYHAGVPFGCVPRAQFRESPVMLAFVRQAMGGPEVPAAAFEAGAWGAYVAALLELSPPPAARPKGAEQAAEYVARLAV